MGERPVLIIELRDQQPISNEEILAALRDRVASWWMPDEVVRVPEMPLTPAGKVYKMRLKSEHGDDLTASLVTSWLITRVNYRGLILSSASKKVGKRRTKAEQRSETISKILDTAEDMFSKHGFYGVTLKDVAKSVGVHHTLVNYYFDDKRKLFDAVFERRALISVEHRMKALDDYEAAAGGRPTVEGALHAFLDTDLDLYIQGGEGWRNYGALSAQVANTPDWGAEMMDDSFDPVVLRLIDLLKQALPDVPEEDIFWGYHFISGALMLTLARTGRIDRLSAGKCSSDDFVAVKERMTTFMASGLLSICQSRAAQ